MRLLPPDELPYDVCPPCQDAIDRGDPEHHCLGFYDAFCGCACPELFRRTR